MDRAYRIDFGNPYTSERETPLWVAVRRGSDSVPDSLRQEYVGVVRDLLDAGADVDGRCGKEASQTPLMVARAQAAQLLLERGADVHACDARGLTALQQADDAQKIVVLLRHGARHDVRDNEGETPLIALLRRDWVEKSAALALIEGRASVHAASPKEGRKALHHTALRYARDRQALQVIEALLRRGAHPDPRDVKGMTPLHVLFRASA